MVGEDGVLQSICEQSTFGIVKDVGVLDWRFKHSGIWPEVLFILATKQTLCISLPCPRTVLKCFCGVNMLNGI